MSNLPLPDGWVKQYDPNYNHPYWVDTRAKPPRAIWVHPYEDEQFMSEHPNLRPKNEANLDAPPSYDVATAGGHVSGSTDKREKPKEKHKDQKDKHVEAESVAGPSSQPEHKRGVFGRLKDKTIGTKEEREEQKRIRAEEAARAEERARRARMRELEEREAYMRANGGYAPYHPSSAGYYGYPAYQPAPQTGPGFTDNTAAMLLGGLAGGLLLGDILGGGF